MSDDSYALHRHFRVSYNANSVNLHGMRNMLRHRADRSERQVVCGSRKIVFRLLILFPAEHFSQPGKDTVGSMIVDMIVIAVFCCIADFVIERDFRFGVISFGLAHLVLIGYIAQLGGFRWGTVVAALIIYGIIALIFRQYLHSLGSMLLPMVLYPLVLSFMTAMAGTLPFAVSPQWILFALGAAAFCISDLFVARDFICGITGTQKNGALILYYLAVYAMASIQLYL